MLFVENLRRYVNKHRSSIFARCLLYFYNLLEGSALFWATFTGYIPSYHIRHILYSLLFRIKLPHDSIICWRCRFFAPWGVKIGHNSIVGNDAFLDGRKGIIIGNNVNIAGEVRIYSLEHDITSTTFGTKGGLVKIDDWVYIGTRVTILPNLTIGQGAVICSGAVVTRDVAPWTMVGGVPAHFIKNRPIAKYTLDTKHKTLFQ